MAIAETPEQFAVVLRARIKRARENAEMTQDAMARHLRIPLATYKKIEGRNSRGLPANLVESFCTVTRTPEKMLFTTKLGPNDLTALAEEKTPAPSRRNKKAS